MVVRGAVGEAEGEEMAVWGGIVTCGMCTWIGNGWDMEVLKRS